MKVLSTTILKDDIGEVLKKEIERYNKNNQPILGCIDRPSFDEPLNLKDVSHKVESFVFKDSGDIDCVIKLLDTPMGIVAQKLIDDGAFFEPTFDSFGNLRSIDLMRSNYGK